MTEEHKAGEYIPYPEDWHKVVAWRLATQGDPMINLLRRAWDALDSFKQAYPENWHEEDEQVMVDLMRADMKLSGVEMKETE